MRRIKLGRILILLVVPILIVYVGFYFIRTSIKQENLVVEQEHGYDVDLFSIENGLMTYKDPSYKVLTGIDVSEHNQDIDWKNVKNDDIDFAIIRVGYRGAQDGVVKEDKYFETNIKQAVRCNLKVGVYFFSSAVTSEEIDEEADMVLSRIKKYEVNMPVVFDMEEIEQGGRVDNLTIEQRTKLALRFCKKIKEASYTPMIYGNMTWLYQNYDFEKISKYPIWLASYSTRCPMEDKFDMWQYSNKGQVNGIEENVDMNIYLQKK